MAKLSALRSDSKKETEGVWVDWEHGVSLLIARLNNPGFQARVRVLSAKHTKQIRAGTFPDEEMEEISKSAMAHHVLLGWKNIENEEGEELDYSQEKALEFLSDPDLRDLYQFVLMQSNERDLYRKDVEEDSSGN